MTRRSGFTVLEQLVSLALLSVLAIGLTGALQFGVRLHSRAKTITENGDILTGRGQFRRLLERASTSASLDHESIEFVGDEHSVSFVTRNRLDFATGIGPMHVYTSVKGEDLQFTIESIGMDTETQSKHSTILSKDSGEPRFRYFDGKIWLNEWKDREDLPRLVSMKFEDSETNRQPDFFVELYYADQ